MMEEEQLGPSFEGYLTGETLIKKQQWAKMGSLGNPVNMQIPNREASVLDGTFEKSILTSPQAIMMKS